ncbi:MAG: hypothetical protein Q9227_003180 [Pyrenula ochraceoflavens]
MAARGHLSDDHELDDQNSFKASNSFDLDREDYELQSLTRAEFQKYPKRSQTSLRWVSHLSDLLRKILGCGRNSNAKRSPLLRRSRNRRLGFILHTCAISLLTLILLTGIFRPSYTHPPLHYEELRSAAESSDAEGRANPRNEKIFIAASIFDPQGTLVTGRWAESVLQLVQLLGSKNVFLSVYENDAGDVASDALNIFKSKLQCENRVVFEAHLDTTSVGTVTVRGEERIDRIAYLAETRNRALTPLEQNKKQFDKMLYLNDVVFNPIEAIQLLFATKIDKDGRTTYRAACAVDFINPFKFYDTFATRDLEGFSMGIPFYPWFTNAGRGDSRRDVLNQKDAVRVRSCWGGMVAFDAKYFQTKQNRLDELDAAGQGFAQTEDFHGFRFRAEKDTFWSASECCLIHADIQSPKNEHEGIYLNPYVRVAYGSRTLSWLGFTRRFERLYSPIHNLLNHMVGMPWFNPRRDQTPGSIVTEKVWAEDISSPGGSYEWIERNGSHAGFCGTRQLQVMRKNKIAGRKPWEIIPAPP